jgi:hypothetical protein
MASTRELELNHQYRMRRMQVVSSVFQKFFGFLCVFAICGCIYLSVRELAGKNTWADVGFRLLADLKVNRFVALMISWVLTGGCVFWALGERSLRKRHIRRISAESSKMQERIDPNRRSSKLTTKGETGREDI